MEEYIIEEHKGYIVQNDLQEPLPQRQGCIQKTGQSIHRHVSLRYGVEFESKVALYVRERSSFSVLAGIEVIPRETLLRKVIRFLEDAIENASLMSNLTKSFKQLDEEMNLSIRKSRNSLSSLISEDLSLDSLGSVELDSSKKKIHNNNAFDIKQSVSPLKENNSHIISKGRKPKTSMMSKCNRISIADVINVSGLQMLKEIQPITAIDSVESLQSEELIDLQSRLDLVSDPSESQSQDGSNHQLQLKIKMAKSKKISIMMVEDLSWDSELFSEEEIISLCELQLPDFLLSQALLEAYFDNSSPYLVNLALCLLFKCLSRAPITLQMHNAGWLLGVATVVAYKVYYDQPIEGLMEFVGEAMKMTVEEMVKLERWFLRSLSYEVVVSSQQYHSMMFRLLQYGDVDKI